MVSSIRGRSFQISGYILIVKPIGFAIILGVEFERKREAKDDTKFFSPSNGQDGVAIYCGRSWDQEFCLGHVMFILGHGESIPRKWVSASNTPERLSDIKTRNWLLNSIKWRSSVIGDLVRAVLVEWKDGGLGRLISVDPQGNEEGLEATTKVNSSRNFL